MTISGLDYVVLIVYLFAFIFAGYVISKRMVKSSKDFATAGQGMGFLTVVGSTVATCMGASIIFGNFQLMYSSGLRGFLIGYFWHIGWIFLVLMSGRLRKSGATSIPQFLEMRYSPFVRKVASYAVLCMGIASTAAQFRAAGSMSEALGLCTATTGIIIGGIVILLFTVFSGMWGVSITSTIQSVLIVITVGIVIPITAISIMGGPAQAVAAADRSMLSFGESDMTISIFIGYALSNLFACGAHPAYASKSLAAKDTKTAVSGQLCALIICGIIQAVALIPVLFGRAMFPNLTDSSQFIPTFIATYFPVGLKGLCISIVLSLLITTGDTFLLLISTTLTEDIIRPVYPNMDDRKMMMLQRFFCVAACGLIIAMSLYIPSIAELFKIGGSAFGCSVFFPALLGCFWKKINTKAVQFAMPFCCVLSIFWDLFLIKLTGQSGSVIAGTASFVICVFGSLILNARKNGTAAQQSMV